jgi:hypothetical protein
MKRRLGAFVPGRLPYFLKGGARNHFPTLRMLTPYEKPRTGAGQARKLTQPESLITRVVRKALKEQPCLRLRWKSYHRLRFPQPWQYPNAYSGYLVTPRQRRELARQTRLFIPQTSKI